MCARSTTSGRVVGRPEGPSWVIFLAGDVDVACRECLRDEFQRAHASRQPVVVDASAVTFLDGGGLRALLAAAACCGEVWLRSASDPFRRVAELTALWDEWETAVSGGDRRLR